MLVLLLAVACDRNTEPFVAGEQPRAPDLSRIFPEADPSAERTAPGDQPSAGARDLAARGMGGGQSPAPPTGASSSESIRGTISIAPPLAEAAPSGAILFVIARPNGVSGGPPLAVLRVPSPQFPFAFDVPKR